jgi:dipeptidyl aminopeptidase/acylaminoacyl peptidase
METKVKFKSDGLTLSGVLHVPDDLAPGEKRAAFVILHGFGGYKDGPEHQAQARIMCEWGYVALRFDMRGCGESEGERGRLIVEEEVRDSIAAFELLEAHEAVDPKKIGLYGDSLGATVAFQAGTDKRVAAVIGSGGIGDGARAFRTMHSTPEAFRTFLDRLLEAKRLYRETGEKMQISRFDIVPIPTDLRSHLGPGALMEFSFETVQSMYDSRAEDHVAEIAPRPLLLIHPASDQVVPAAESYEVLKRAGQPTELYITAGEDHFPLSSKNPQSPLIIKLWLERFFPAKKNL